MTRDSSGVDGESSRGPPGARPGWPTASRPYQESHQESHQEPHQEAERERTPREKDIFGREPEGHPDWSHRRGEPRVFALIWMLFLMGVTAVMFMSLHDALSISPSITRPAARGMLLTTMAGVVLLWPALRLSQRPARSPVGSVLRDMFVLLAPAQAVIWPHAVRELAWWPWTVLVAVAASMLAWAMVVGGLIAAADATQHAVCAVRPGRGRLASGGARWAWMLVVLAVVFIAPLVGIVSGGRGPAWAGGNKSGVRAGWMLSPLTSVIELTRDRSGSGSPTPISGTHWRLIAGAGCVGGGLLFGALAVEVATRRRVA